jgi:hypothetical protein
MIGLVFATGPSAAGFRNRVDVGSGPALGRALDLLSFVPQGKSAVALAVAGAAIVGERLSMMGEPIQGSTRQEIVAEELAPLLEDPIARYDDRAAFEAFARMDFIRMVS